MDEYQVSDALEAPLAPRQFRPRSGKEIANDVFIPGKPNLGIGAEAGARPKSIIRAKNKAMGLGASESASSLALMGAPPSPASPSTTSTSAATPATSASPATTNAMMPRTSSMTNFRPLPSLPADWVEKIDAPTGRVYWENVKTHETRWVRPVAQRSFHASGSTRALLSAAMEGGEVSSTVPGPAPAGSGRRLLTQGLGAVGGDHLLKARASGYMDVGSTSYLASSSTKVSGGTNGDGDGGEGDEDEEDDDGDDDDDARHETLIDVVSTERPMRELKMRGFAPLDAKLVVPNPRETYGLECFVETHV